MVPQVPSTKKATPPPTYPANASGVDLITWPMGPRTSTPTKGRTTASRTRRFLVFGVIGREHGTSGEADLAGSWSARPAIRPDGRRIVEASICVTCGVQQAPSDEQPESCPICEDERQYVRPGGQAWTTLAGIAAQGHRIELREQEPGLTGVGIEPSFGIGQRALLLETPDGNFLWDCMGFIDDPAVKAIESKGGIAGIAASHPHFYGVMVEWSRAFGGAPVHVPEADLEWVQRPDPAVRPWSGTLEVLPGVSLVQCGGHFDGSAVLHWAAGADGRGALLVGDTMAVVSDVRY